MARTRRRAEGETGRSLSLWLRAFCLSPPGSAETLAGPGGRNITKHSSHWKPSFPLVRLPLCSASSRVHPPRTHPRGWPGHPRVLR